MDLHEAAEKGNLERIQELVSQQLVNVNSLKEKKGKPHKTQKWGPGYYNTALHLASGKGHEKIVDFLLNKAKADPDIKTRRKHTEGWIPEQCAEKPEVKKIFEEYRKKTSGSRSEETLVIENEIEDDNQWQKKLEELAIQEEKKKKKKKPNTNCGNEKIRKEALEKVREEQMKTSREYFKDLRSIEHYAKAAKIPEGKRPNILLVGKTGVGKTSLVKHLFGEGKVGFGVPVTTEIRKFPQREDNINTASVVLYDSMGFEMGTEEPEKKLLEFLEYNKKAPLEEKIHFVWYLISVTDARITRGDKMLCEEMFKDIPVMILLTKSDKATKEQVKKLKSELDKLNISNLVGIYAVSTHPENVFPYPVLCVSKSCYLEDPNMTSHPAKIKCNNCGTVYKACPYCDNPNVSQVWDSTSKEYMWMCANCLTKWPLHKSAKNEIENALDKSFHIMEELGQEYAIGFARCVKNRQLSWKYRSLASIPIILAATTAAVIIGLSPLPVADAMLLAPDQTSMILAIGKIWGFDNRRALALSSSTTLISTGIGVGAVSILKLIPWTKGFATAINVSVGAAITAAIGCIYSIALGIMHMRGVDLTNLEDSAFFRYMAPFLKKSYVKQVVMLAHTIIKTKGLRKVTKEDIATLLQTMPLPVNK